MSVCDAVGEGVHHGLLRPRGTCFACRLIGSCAGEGVRRAMRPWARGDVYLNFILPFFEQVEQSGIPPLVTLGHDSGIGYACAGLVMLVAAAIPEVSNPGIRATTKTELTALLESLPGGPGR